MSTGDHQNRKPESGSDSDAVASGTPPWSVIHFPVAAAAFDEVVGVVRVGRVVFTCFANPGGGWSACLLVYLCRALHVPPVGRSCPFSTQPHRARTLLERSTHKGLSRMALGIGAGVTQIVLLAISVVCVCVLECVCVCVCG